MTNDTNKIISVGLVVMGIFAVLGWLAISWKTGTNTGTEIPIGIISGLVGVLTGRGMAEKEQQSKTAEALGKVAQTATQAQTAVNAVESISNIFKSGKKE